jgi:hypothetical protein
MRVLPIVIAAFSIVAAAGCASPRPAADPGQVDPSQPAPDVVPGGELVVYANGNASSLRVEGERTWGPSAELKRFDDSFRGTLQGHVVDLHYNDDHLHGLIGSSKVDLHITTVDGKIHGQGLLQGHISTFDVDAEAIEGSFGNCSYQMKRKSPESDDYLGYRSCSGSNYPASRITIPGSIRALPAMDQATLYALMFQG